MHLNNEQFKALVKLILPSEIFEYFELINIDLIDNEIHVYLDELNIKPKRLEQMKIRHYNRQKDIDRYYRYDELWE